MRKRQRAGTAIAALFLSGNRRRKGKDAARLLHLGIVICAGPAVSSALIR